MIEKVILQESEIVEENGNYKQVFKEKKVVPCLLTNYSLKKGKDLGLLQNSLVADIMRLIPLMNLKSADEIDAETMKEFDEIEMMKVIYLGCIGASQNLGLSFDEFVSQYHDSYENTIILYAKLATSLVKKDPNQFSKAFKSSTKNNKKKFNHQKSRSNA